ncbi:MAG: D-2-hydroxyacid dehydrogenase, partial [Coriobacteriaceae bacterium]|nr:D-2-hydroxyacid dehydrogenase [Coriobacteriaceae bacterium]
MPHADLTNKHVLITLPLTDGQKDAFRRLVEGAGGTASFVLEPLVVDADTEEASVIIGNVPARTLHGSQKLAWLQTSSAGYDHYLAEGLLDPSTTLTNATGAYGRAVSEHMIASLLCLMKKLQLYRDSQRASRWKDEGPVTSLVGAKVLVMGAGDIGTAFAQLVTALGARAWGVRRHVEERRDPFERMIALDDVRCGLGDVDVVACVLPSSPETRGFCDAAFFSAMKEGSFFVNAGRGDLVDQDALAEALACGHLAGAALDVTSPEPLPVAHPL